MQCAAIPCALVTDVTRRRAAPASRGDLTGCFVLPDRFILPSGAGSLRVGAQRIEFRRRKRARCLSAMVPSLAVAQFSRPPAGMPTRWSR
jgi:hypothetical protein